MRGGGGAGQVETMSEGMEWRALPTQICFGGKKSLLGKVSHCVVFIAAGRRKSLQLLRHTSKSNQFDCHGTKAPTRGEKMHFQILVWNIQINGSVMAGSVRRPLQFEWTNIHWKYLLCARHIVLGVGWRLGWIRCSPCSTQGGYDHVWQRNTSQRELKHKAECDSY